jgi:hypothetical protein
MQYTAKDRCRVGGMDTPLIIACLLTAALLLLIWAVWNRGRK